MDFQKIVVVGLGYIGLPTAAMFASRKIRVVGYDINQTTVDTINQGKIHIVEPDLDMLVHAAVHEGYLKASTEIESADAFLIAVPTPFKENFTPDLSFIRSAAETIAPLLTKGNLIILESTSPVGTTEQLAAWLAELRPDLSFPQNAGDRSDIRISHCPERVLPGHVVRELVENDRVIGGISQLCSEQSVALYRTFVTGECIITNARTAEMAKLTENASRDVSIAFANELSLICDRLNINVWELIDLANRHPRVNILKPGPGVGGHCIAVDPWFIVNSAPQESNLIRCARLVNESKPAWVVEKVKNEVSAFLLENPSISASGVTVACLGLAFKADIDDLRESPALSIATQLINELPCYVMAVEPNRKTLPESIAGDIELVNIADALDLAHIIVLLVDHAEFKALDLRLLEGKRIIDTRGIWNRPVERNKVSGILAEIDMLNKATITGSGIKYKDGKVFAAVKG